MNVNADFSNTVTVVVVRICTTPHIVCLLLPCEIIWSVLAKKENACVSKWLSVTLESLLSSWV